MQKGLKEWEESGVRIIGYSILGSVLLIGAGWLAHLLLTKEVSPSSPVRLWDNVTITFPFSLPKFVGLLGGFLVGPIAFILLSGWDDDEYIIFGVGLVLGAVIGLGLALGFELAQSWITILGLLPLPLVDKILLMARRRFNISEGTNDILFCLTTLTAITLGLWIAWLFTFVPSWVSIALGVMIAIAMSITFVRDQRINQLLLVVGLFFGIQLPAILGLGLLSGAISGLLVLAPFVIGWSFYFVLLALVRDTKKLLSLVYHSLFKKTNLTYSK